MFWQLVALLTIVSLQQGPGSPPSPSQSGAQIPAGWTLAWPDQQRWQRCMRPLGADGTANSRMTVRCERVENGEPKACQLDGGREHPVRHRAAARCLAPLYRFTGADGQPANGGPVTIAISVNVTVTNVD